jgi:hypothetical protein
VGDDSDPVDTELELQKWRTLYELTQANLARASDQWRMLDDKTMNYSTLLGVVVAVAALSLDSIIRLEGQPYSWVFFLVYFLFWLAALLAFVHFVAALKIVDTETPAFGAELLDHFRANRYIDVLYSMSRRFSEATVRHRTQSEKKAVLAARGYTLFLITLTFGLVSSVVYIPLGVMRMRMADDQKAPPAASAPKSTPNPAVIAPANVPEKKGIEGGTNKAVPPAEPGTKR